MWGWHRPAPAGEDDPRRTLAGDVTRHANRSADLVLPLHSPGDCMNRSPCSPATVTRLILSSQLLQSLRSLSALSYHPPAALVYPSRPPLSPSCPVAQSSASSSIRCCHRSCPVRRLADYRDKMWSASHADGDKSPCSHHPGFHIPDSARLVQPTLVDVHHHGCEVLEGLSTVSAITAAVVAKR